MPILTPGRDNERSPHAMMETMQLVTVIPIKRAIGVEELSYFSPERVPLGAIVSVPLRGKSTTALVVRCVEASTARADIRAAQFALKKLGAVKAKGFFRPEFIDAARECGEYFVASTGSILGAILPKALLGESAPAPFGTRTKSAKPERFVFQAEDAERFATYKSLVREQFANGLSTFLILPSIQDIEHAYQSIEKGIRDFTFILHGGLPKKELLARWRAACTLEHPVLVIATPYFAHLPRTDLATIIVDKESSSAYKLQGRPFVDLRYFLERYAERIGARLIAGDIFLRVETLARAERGDFEAFARPKFRLVSPAVSTIIDMRTLGEQPATGKVAICSPELVDAIEDARKTGTQVFILGVRRGYAPMTVCGDCGEVVSCTRCSAPVVLYKRPGVKPEAGAEAAAHAFVCHRCGTERAADETCKTCGGWRLVSLGFGIEQAAESIRSRFSDAAIFRIDRDSTGTHKEAAEVARQFFATPGGIMIGTEMALPYLTAPVATVAVLSVNSLLTIPDFRMNERVFRLLLSLRAKAERRFLIQTRETSHALFGLAAGGNIVEFMRAELEERKALGYPPYSVLIKFTYEGKKQDGVDAMAEIERIFGVYHPVTFPSFIARVKNQYRMNGLIKIPDGKWPDPELAALIRTLPQETSVKVDPESVI